MSAHNGIKYKKEIEQFCNGALTALLWTEELDGFEVDSACEERFREFCAMFFILFDCQWNALAAFDRDFDRYVTYGHDFVLTWNGHGAGIWDRYLEYNDPYSRLAFDLLTVPLNLAIREMSHALGKIDAGKDHKDGYVLIDVPRLCQESLRYDQRWLNGVMGKWQPEFKRFVRNHIEIPKPVRKRRVKI